MPFIGSMEEEMTNLRVFMTWKKMVEGRGEVADIITKWIWKHLAGGKVAGKPMWFEREHILFRLMQVSP